MKKLALIAGALSLSVGIAVAASALQTEVPMQVACATSSPFVTTHVVDGSLMGEPIQQDYR